MEKKEYLAARLRHDFIRYVLLKKPLFPDEDISRKLKEKIDADMLYDNIKKHIPAVIDEYLSPERLKDKNGNFVDELPEWLTPALADKVVSIVSSTSTSGCCRRRKRRQHGFPGRYSRCGRGRTL